VSDKPAEILSAARSLFSTKGYAATSMRDIANAVGLQPGSLYAHMAAKEDLLSTILTEAGDRFLRTVVPLLDAPDVPAAERLQQAIQAHVRVVAENLEEATVFFHEWRSLSGNRRTAALKTRRT
jgi:AcrR family transcriptional regulator